MIGEISLIKITNAGDFMNQSTLCEGNISVSRMKEIKKRCMNLKKDLIHEKLSSYAETSPRLSKLFEFNSKWYKKMNIPDRVKCLDFAADNFDEIEIIRFTQKGIVINALKPGCSFNGEKLSVGNQYSVTFEILNRSGNNGSEYFLQKQCASYLKSSEKQLIKEVIAVIK